MLGKNPEIFPFAFLVTGDKMDEKRAGERLSTSGGLLIIEYVISADDHGM